MRQNQRSSIRFTQLPLSTIFYLHLEGCQDSTIFAIQCAQQGKSSDGLGKCSQCSGMDTSAYQSLYLDRRFLSHPFYLLNGLWLRLRSYEKETKRAEE